MNIMSIKANKFFKTSLLLSLLTLTACLDPIELKIPEGFDETLVIQGVLTKGSPSSMELTVTRMFDFTIESLTRVNVSEVILSDEEGNSVEIDRAGTGLYRTVFDESHPIEIALNKSYKVNILTFDGRRYESTLEALLPVPQVDSLAIQGIEKEIVFADGETTRVDSLVRLALYTPLSEASSGERVSLKWDLRRVYRVTDTPIEVGVQRKTCYLTEDINITTVKIFDANDLGTIRLEDYEVFDQAFNPTMGEGLYYELIQSSLTPTAFEYFDQVRQVLEREGNMFEAPPGKLVTNFINTEDAREEVFGYFYATTTDTARVYVSPDFANFPRTFCPPASGLTRMDGSCAAPTCCDCLSFENSTTIRPSFWVE
jgi:hypothetical protein